MSFQDGRGSGPPPHRWMHCPRKAASLVAEKFLAFKTPLGAQFDDQVPEECRFYPGMVFTSMRSYKVSIGLWIDLTNTSRFYDKQEVEAQGCKYLKLQCRGHAETPSEDQARAFVQICHQFFSHHPLEIIGVHCTHGFNRTGFLIACYLVEKMDFSVEAAITQFAKVRPPGIYKADYIQELFRRYDDVDDALPAPNLPSWHTESDDSNGHGDSAAAENDRGPSHKPNYCISSPSDNESWRRKREFQKKDPTFMEGVSGVTPVTTQPKLGHIQKTVQHFCGWTSSGFPGCQPVSMDTTNIGLLQEKPYRVSWKADGTRYMMLILGDHEIYFIDRDNSVFEVTGLRFPHRKDFNRHLTNTLLDGEMVIDKVGGQHIPRYLAYDIIKFENQDVGKLPFYPVRLSCIDKEIVAPRHAAMKEGRIDRMKEPFSVRIKQFWDVTQAHRLLDDKFCQMLSHEPDGLIFQPSKDPYTAGRCVSVLKWKPLCLNSVDFKVKIVMEEGQGIVPRKVGQLFVGGMDRPFATMRSIKAIKELNNKIVECKFENNQWVFMRERTDKSFPNSFDTAAGVCNSIRDPITKEKLFDFIEHHRWHDDDHSMMPPPSKVRR